MGRGKSNKPTQEFIREQFKSFNDFIGTYVGQDNWEGSGLEAYFITNIPNPNLSYSLPEQEWWRSKQHVFREIFRSQISTYTILESSYNSPGVNSYKNENRIVPLSDSSL
jgi:hypothetical protein